MPMGTAFRTPSGDINCESGTFGIRCIDRRIPQSFTIGDTRVIIRPYRDGAASPTSYFNSYDRLQRCYIDDSYANCTSSVSGQGVSLDAGNGGASYEGKVGSTYHGGPDLRFGQTKTNRSGTITCDSGTFGIRCRSRVSGSYFVIGDKYVRVGNGGVERRYDA
jgi:hypothetical protein